MYNGRAAKAWAYRGIQAIENIYQRKECWNRYFGNTKPVSWRRMVMWLPVFSRVDLDD